MTLAVAKLSPRRRGFTLEVFSEGHDAYGLHLSETGNQDGGVAGLKLRAKASRARRVLDSALTAVRVSGYEKTVLGVHRTRPIALTEEAGVRLALVLLTTAPLVKSRRVDAMARAVDAMSTEEAYYWYAKCVGEDAARARRALRLLLAEE